MAGTRRGHGFVLVAAVWFEPAAVNLGTVVMQALDHRPLGGEPGAVHVAHLIARLNDGGPARVIAALARSLAPLGVRSTVLAGATGPDEPDLAASLAAAGLDVRRLPGLSRRPAPLADLRALAGIAAVLRGLRPDLVHTHTSKAGLLGRAAARALGLPCLHTWHGHVFAGHLSAPRARLLAALERHAQAGAHQQALTPSLLRDLRDRLRIGRPRRWHLLPIPVEPVVLRRPAWMPPPGPPVVGMLARLAPVKGGERFLLAAAALARRRPLRVLVCGDGGERPRLEALARRLGLDARFTGFVPAGEALAAMDLLVVASRHEGLPVAAVEAMHAGVPVVAAAVGGLRDLGAAGALRAVAGGPPALAGAIAGLLDDADARAAQIAAGRAYAAGLLPEALAPRYLALYRAIVARRIGAGAGRARR